MYVGTSAAAVTDALTISSAELLAAFTTIFVNVCAPALPKAFNPPVKAISPINPKVYDIPVPILYPIELGFISDSLFKAA